MLDPLALQVIESQFLAADELGYLVQREGEAPCILTPNVERLRELLPRLATRGRPAAIMRLHLLPEAPTP